MLSLYFLFLQYQHCLPAIRKQPSIVFLWSPRKTTLAPINILTNSLSPLGSIFQILTCLIWELWVYVIYLFTECVTKSCDPPYWMIQTCYPSASSCVTETTFLTQNCFSVENLIIVLLNTAIPIIYIVYLPNVTWCLHKQIIYSHSVLVTFFNIVFQLMHTAYWHKPDFSVVMCLFFSIETISICCQCYN